MLPASMLDLRIVRGPLGPQENEAILSQYNRLTLSRIPMQEFLHWIQCSPEGPAWHAILETDDGEIVGHTSLIPLRASYRGRRIVPAKSEYSFICEEYRAAKIRGFEDSGRLRNLIYIDRLFRHCAAQGWGPLLISTASGVHRLFPSVGCYPTSFPVRECLLILRPWNAARKTPNLAPWQRASIWSAGILQQIGWSSVLLLARRTNGISTVSLGNGSPPKPNDLLSFFEDPDSSQWRYLAGQYERLTLDAEGREFVIVKKGMADRYLRVCQWQLASGQPSLSLVAELVQLARKEKALGVRWAIYGDDQMAGILARRIQRLGFLCARRSRTLLVHTSEQEFLAGENWNLTDAMFSFDP